ncbi:hypothetical protein ORI20_13795 [Mycobacterium sp. CVI_P3]|uniref:Integral membrane protein n=1 Tax=Mycobacterium pinniadriaticum TaxID=2994102 RepID=A0ABT3SE41_9MYCO|nr:hypothetical protein [Mycobacterium pinniadriaticum]MCX2931352.1 hypothetical protein [Mycobacterium pinniadriaticum]MCX2937776.1 hypothetical protein [Mycobacterium pinniadriaticum]
MSAILQFFVELIGTLILVGVAAGAAVAGALNAADSLVQRRRP